MCDRKAEEESVRGTKGTGKGDRRHGEDSEGGKKMEQTKMTCVYKNTLKKPKALEKEPIMAATIYPG